MRAAKIQLSPGRNLPLPPDAIENETTTPCSSTTCVAELDGTVIRPLDPDASRSVSWLPAPSLTAPDWSQRRTRRWRCAASSALAGRRSVGIAPVNVIVRSASSTVTLRSTPGFWFELVVVVEDLDPVVRRDAQHVVLADGREPEHRRRDHLDDRDRDRAVVARPLERRRARRAAVVDLDAVRLVLEAAVAAVGRQLARIVVVRDVDRVRSSGVRRTARSCRATRGCRRRPTRTSRCRCSAAGAPATRSAYARSCRRRPRSRRGPGSSSAVTSRCQTSR